MNPRSVLKRLEAMADSEYNAWYQREYKKALAQYKEAHRIFKQQMRKVGSK